jgi:hypothetical protein
MRMAGNDHVHSVQRRIELQFLKVVQNIDRAAAQPYRVGVGLVFCPIAGIDVAPYRSDRRNSRSPAITSGRPISPAWMICTMPASRCSTWGCRRPWVSEMTPTLSTAPASIDAFPNGRL